jgi:hypothetical protein
MFGDLSRRPVQIVAEQVTCNGKPPFALETSLRLTGTTSDNTITVSGANIDLVLSN